MTQTLNDYIDPKTTDIDVCLDLLIRSLTACSTLGLSIQYPTFTSYTFGYMKGRKYTRVWQDNGTQRMVCFFVQNDNGDVWKAGGWAKPALNFTRGNILSPEGRAALTIGKIQPSGYFYPAF